MYKRIGAFILILFVMSITGCSNGLDLKNETIAVKVKPVDIEYEKLYEDIISNIDKTDRELEYTGGISKYLGYQLYDRNNDGIKELYIYRVHNFNTSQLTIQGMSSKPFIYVAYNIVDKKPVCFLSGEPRGSSTHDDCYFALKDGSILHLNNSYSDENISIIDDKENIIIEFHCDYAYVGGNPEYDVYKIDGNIVNETTYKEELGKYKTLIGCFETDINN